MPCTMPCKDVRRQIRSCLYPNRGVVGSTVIQPFNHDQHVPQHGHATAMYGHGHGRHAITPRPAGWHSVCSYIRYIAYQYHHTISLIIITISLSHISSSHHVNIDRYQLLVVSCIEHIYIGISSAKASAFFFLFARHAHARC